MMVLMVEVTVIVDALAVVESCDWSDWIWLPWEATTWLREEASDESEETSEV
jgi:hypothetical protein